MWNFIFKFVFDRLGGLSFLIICDYKFNEIVSFLQASLTAMEVNLETQFSPQCHLCNVKKLYLGIFFWAFSLSGFIYVFLSPCDSCPQLIVFGNQCSCLLFSHMFSLLSLLALYLCSLCTSPECFMLLLMLILCPVSNDLLSRYLPAQFALELRVRYHEQ